MKLEMGIDRGIQESRWLGRENLGDEARAGSAKLGRKS
jgi:hypothetical protein